MTMSAGSNEQHQVRPPFGPSAAAPQPIAIPGGAIVPVQVQQNSVQVPMSGLLSPASALEHYRLTQLYQYAMAAERLRCPPGTFLPPIPPGLRPELAPLFYGSYCRIDPRLAGLCRPPEEPKPQHSYIGLIAMAILGHPDKKLVLSDIYQYILDNYPYFRSRGPGWRNSIRHNLSLNDCFIKAGRSANGKGHYWAIHPANVDDFTKGDFRRRKAQRKVRRHMGLAVDDEDSPSPPPASPPPAWHHPHHGMTHAGGHLPHPVALAGNSPNSPLDLPATLFGLSGGGVGVNKYSPGQGHLHALTGNPHHHHPILNRKRQFDVASLLAPEKNMIGRATSPSSKSDDHDHDNDNNSLSSSSPPSSIVNSSSKNSKLFKKSVDSDDDDDEPIEVTEDTDNDIEKGNEGLSPSRCRRRRHNSHGGNDDVELENDEVTSSMGNNSRTQFQRSGQQNDGGNSSNDEEDVFTNSPSRHSRHVRSGSSNGNANNGSGGNNIDRRGSPSSTNNSMCPIGNNNSAFAIANELLSHNQVMGQNQHPQQSGMPPLEFLGAQHLFNQGPHGQQFQFNPNHHPLLQHNPSLASLMILSSRYREITSNMANAKRTQQ